MNAANYHFHCPTETETSRLARNLAEKAWPGMVLNLEGTLGAGKTVFARGFARGLQIEENITSPSYPIIQEYHGRLPFYHMDWYRLGSEDEVLETGVAELMDASGVCLVEWPDRAAELFDDQTIRVSIHILPDESRAIRIRIESAEVLKRLGWPEGLPPGSAISESPP